ncbi:MAG TPA: hypothetical protein VHD32_18070 [Candidatus Didemnitutus sp.]|nr:hypothetical protein [Candidatus Didemnitutus sp.]
MAELATEPTPPARGHSWTAVIGAGVISSLVFQVLEAGLIPLVGGGSPWGPARMIAAIVLGRSVLPPPATFALAPVVTALVVDIALAIIYVAALSLIVRRLSLSAALGVAAVFGFVLYFVNFYGFTMLFPWFVMGRNWVTIFTHVVFSLTAVFAYRRLARRG